MDCSLPGSFVHGILQARIPEWVAVSFSRGSSAPRDRTQVSCIANRFLTIWATREALCLLFWLFPIPLLNTSSSNVLGVSRGQGYGAERGDGQPLLDLQMWGGTTGLEQWICLGWSEASEKASETWHQDWASKEERFSEWMSSRGPLGPGRVARKNAELLIEHLNFG